MSLWVPGQAALDMQEQRAALLRSQLDQYREQFRYWNQKLKEIDPYLELVRANDDADAPGLKPGYWHVIRHKPGAPPSVIIHQGPNGEYRDPDSGLYEQLQRGDMWNDRATREREKLQQKAERAKQREEEQEAHDRVEELTQRLRSMKGSQIMVSRDIGEKP